MLSQLQIELTNVCNCECLFCSNRLSKREITHMNLDLLGKIVDELVDMKLPNPTGICGIGEPTLYPEFNNAIEIISRVPFSLGTNAINLTEDKIDTIIKYEFVDVSFSIDATTSETYFNIKNNENFDKAIEHISLFLDKIKGKYKFWNNIYLQFVYSELNQYEVQDFVDYWQESASEIDGILIYIKSLCPSPVVEANCLYPPLLVDLSHLKHDNVVVDQLDKPIRFTNCELFKSFALIMSDGAYSPCCMTINDVYKVGNVQNMSIKECYESNTLQEYIKLQSNHKHAQIPFCKDCKC